MIVISAEQGGLVELAKQYEQYATDVVPALKAGIELWLREIENAYRKSGGLGTRDDALAWYEEDFILWQQRQGAEAATVRDAYRQAVAEAVALGDIVMEDGVERPTVKSIARVVWLHLAMLLRQAEDAQRGFEVGERVSVQAVLTIGAALVRDINERQGISL
jgi:hypothetical protein